jgi:GT2 family glycosyltransferase/glycosyltransferase involved in cell wall biosynthesis
MRVWKPIVWRLLRAGRVREIVEIGAERGELTKELAAYARAHGGTLHSIDPEPRFDVREFEMRFGASFRFHRKRSLEALPDIGPVDMALIDGDHNWFTVLSELRLLGRSGLFPMTLLHDVGWPYGRRDLYYQPGAIPKGMRQPYRRLGIAPETGELTEAGFNAHLAQAEFEGGPRNGVLTAVDDFIAEFDSELKFIELAGLHGLGILVPEERLEQGRLRKVVRRIESKDGLRERISMLEEQRLEAVLALQRQRQRLDHATKEAEQATAQFAQSRLARKRERARSRRLLGVRADELDLVALQLLGAEAALADEREARSAESAALKAVRDEARELKAALEAAKQRVSELTVAETELRVRLADHERQLTEQQGARAELAAAADGLREELVARAGDLAREAAAASELERQLQAKGDRLLAIERRVADLVAAEARLADDLEERERQLAGQHEAVAELGQEVERLRQDLAAQRGEAVTGQAALARYVERVDAERRELAAAAERLAASRSWRYGHGVFLLLRRLRPGRTREESALDVISERLQRPLAPPRLRDSAPATPRMLKSTGGADARDAAAPEQQFPVALPVPPPGPRFDPSTLERLDGAPPITVLIPVYNATTQVRRCVEALARNTSMPAEVLIIDDASTDEGTAELLRRYESLAGVTVVRNEENCGFTCTVNRGMGEAEGDVVLLNSDTEVGPRWLESLRTLAYSAAEIGSVTPLSDNAGAFSAPVVGERNSTPPGLGTDQVARLVAQTGRGIAPTTPTGSGFCLYLKREMIDDIGELDAERFPRGYGEENDYCMRARAAGWWHVVDDRTYVRHEREASFGAEKRELMEAGRKAVDGLHPTYTDDVRRFVRSEAMDEVRASIRFAFEHHAETAPRPRVLFVLHEGTGGTPATNEDLMRALDDDYDCFVLTSNSRTLRLRRYGRVPYEVDAWELREPWRATDFSRPDFTEVAIEVLSTYAIELVHVRHLFKHTLDLPRVAKAMGIPTVVSFHDFYMACPTVHLLDDKDRYCGGTCTPGEGVCRRPSALLVDTPPLKHAWVNVWRESFGEILRDASALVTTSGHAREVYQRAYPDLTARFEVIEHGRDFAARQTTAERPRSDAPLRILVPGRLEFHKGSGYLARLKELDGEGRLEFHFLGPRPDDAALESLGFHHGPYERDEFVARAAKIRPAVVGIFSVWPETYCHVLTEAWAAGIPVVATDIGALGERVRARGGGWLVPRDDPEAAYERLVGLATDEAAFDRATREIAASRIRDTAAMARDYDALYRRVLQSRRPIVATASTPAMATLNARVVKVDACVPGRPGFEPGSSYVRVLTRLSYPAIARKVQARFPEPGRLLSNGDRPDLALVQRTAIDPAAVPELIERVHSKGTPLIFELDDDLMALEDDPKYGGHVGALRALTEAATLVTVSTPALADSVTGLARDVAVIPNALDERLWFGPIADSDRTEPQADAGSIRVLYMGTRTHAEDLRLLEPVLRRLREDGGVDVRLEVIGAEPPGPGQDWYRRLDVPGAKVVYPNFVRWLRDQADRWDVAVAPLVDKSFNRSKSDLKFLEYAALGLPTVVSDVEAYRSVRDGVSGRKVGNDVDEWAAALLSLAGDDGLRDRFAAVAREEVRASRCLEVEAPRYFSMLCEVADRDAAGAGL